MKINEIIKAKRKEQNLTQEQIALFLGVSAPAVNKWEKGHSYPDITILPALARLLKVDLNTLLTFQDDLTEQEIGTFAAEMIALIREKSYEDGFQKAMDKIQEFPHCDLLISTLALTLEGALFLYFADSKEPDKREIYRVEIEKLYERAAVSENIQIRNQCNTMLIHRYMEREEYEKAQALLDRFPATAFDKKQMQSKLYVKQGKLSEASELLEQKLLLAANETFNTLIGLMEIAQKEKDDSSADYFAAVSAKTAALYDLWEYFSYIAPFQLSVAQKKAADCIEILEKMLPALQRKWNTTDSLLYKHIRKKSGEAYTQNVLLSMIIHELQTDQEFDFLRSHPGFLKLMRKFQDSQYL